jgi:integrase
MITEIQLEVARKPKGSVGIESINGALRLRLPRHVFKGYQKYLYLGLSDTARNRKLAEAKVQQIESDIFFERFDPTLERYKPPSYSLPAKPEKPSLTLSSLWDKYTQFKTKTLSPSSLKDFKKIANHIKKLPTQSPDAAKQIANHLIDTLSLESAKRTLTQLSACCDWAVDRDLIEKNSFTGMTKRLKVTKKHLINPFTAQERDAIIKAFEEFPQHRHYAPYVKFLFLTGCRTSEAVGLQWQHIDLAMTFVTFQEVVVDGQRHDTTKTHKIRRFPINQSLKNLLIEIKPDAPHPSAPVFTDSIGNLVRPSNFSRRHWQPVVNSLGIVYRTQYNTRHTFITLCLEAKVPVAQIAAWVGNSPRIIWEHYAGLIQSEVPEI